MDGGDGWWTVVRYGMFLVLGCAERTVVSCFQCTQHLCMYDVFFYVSNRSSLTIRFSPFPYPMRRFLDHLTNKRRQAADSQAPTQKMPHSQTTMGLNSAGRPSGE